MKPQYKDFAEASNQLKDRKQSLGVISYLFIKKQLAFHNGRRSLLEFCWGPWYNLIWDLHYFIKKKKITWKRE